MLLIVSTDYKYTDLNKRCKVCKMQKQQKTGQNYLSYNLYYVK